MSNSAHRLARGASHWRIATQITIAYAIALGCALALGAVAIERLEGVEAAAQEMRAHWLPRTRAFGDLLFLAQRFRVIEAALVMAPPEGKAAETKTLQGLRGQIDKALDTQASLSRDDAERRSISEIGALWRAYADWDAKFVATASANKDGDAATLYRGEMREAIHNFQDRLNQEVAGNIARGEEAAESGRKLGQDALFKIVAMLLAATAFSVASGLMLWRGVAKPIAALTRAMMALARGETQIGIPALELGNEVGEMARATRVFKDDSLNRRAKLEIEATEQRLAADAERERGSADRAHAHAALREAMGGLGAALQRLAAGDLDQRLSENFSSEYAGVRDDFNEATAKLKAAMAAVVECADSIETNSREIATASNELSLRTEQQAASIEQTSAALEQITSAVQKSAEAVAHAREVVAATDSDSQRIAQTVANAVSAMDEISKSANHIAQIIGVIDEIAFQTNLLALNAGVEAARAGDAGKGFAVVASEVRALALRSAEAAKEIKRLISASSDQVENGVALVGETGAALKRIGAEISRINGIVNQIAHGARDQASSLDEVNIAIREMDRTTQQNAAMVEESTASTQSLSRDAARLAELVSQFGAGRVLSEPRLRRELQAAAPHAFHSGDKPSASTPKARATRRPGVVALNTKGAEWEDF